MSDRTNINSKSNLFYGHFQTGCFTILAVALYMLSTTFISMQLSVANLPDLSKTAKIIQEIHER